MYADARCAQSPQRMLVRMDWIAAVSEWKSFKSEVRAQWAQLTDMQLDMIAGQRGQLSEQIRESYGLTRDQAEGEIVQFEARNQYLRPVSSR